MSQNKWQVGQKVWVQLYDRRGCHYETITKIGRRWATLDASYRQYRFDLETLLIDGGEFSPPGRVWASKEDQELAAICDLEWKNTFYRLCTIRPDHVTLADINAIREILKLESAK
jgi:hypothetical protein